MALVSVGGAKLSIERGTESAVPNVGGVNDDVGESGRVRSSA